MKDPITTPGRTYAVTSPNGCTVTTEDGLTLAEVEAGKQGYFVAVSGKVLLSDEAAVLTQVFKLAPYQKLRLLGVVGGDVPVWFKALETELTALLDGSKFELAWLAGEKTLVVHTDRISDELSDAVTALLERVLPKNVEVVRYNHHIEVSWRDVNKYALCTNATELCSVEPEKVVIENYGFGKAVYTTDFTSDGQFGYPIPKMVSLNTSGLGGSVFAKTPAEIFRISAPALVNGGRCIRLIMSKEIYLDAPNVNSFAESQVSKVEKIWCNSEKIVNLFGAFESPYLREVQIVFPVLNTGKKGFNKAILNKESALRILNSIPEWSDGNTHELTIGIHVDHKQDEEVLAAIANAESKGWTMTVQWNGTPTAQANVTYGLRKPPIYAKVGEIELPDGTTERVLDWGHYVTDPTGYEEFRSVEAAREYFSLPDEPLTETE